MTSRTRRAGSASHGPEEQPVAGALGELLEVERRLEAEVAAAWSEAARRVESARSAADALAAEDDGSFEAALVDLRNAIDAELTEALASLESDAVAGAEAFLQIDGRTLERLVREFAAEVLGGAAE